jgi:hypothetical protein
MAHRSKTRAGRNTLAETNGAITRKHLGYRHCSEVFMRRHNKALVPAQKYNCQHELIGYSQVEYGECN